MIESRVWTMFNSYSENCRRKTLNWGLIILIVLGKIPGDTSFVFTTYLTGKGMLYSNYKIVSYYLNS